MCFRHSSLKYRTPGPACVFCSHHTSSPGFFLPAGSSSGRANACQPGSSPCRRHGISRKVHFCQRKVQLLKGASLVNYRRVVWTKQGSPGSCFLGMLACSRQGPSPYICMGDAGAPGVPATRPQSQAPNTRYRNHKPELGIKNRNQFASSRKQV